MIANGEVKYNVESDNAIEEYVTDIAFEFEGGPFEDDKAWFLSFEEGQKDEKMMTIVLVLISIFIVICLCAIATPIIVILYCKTKKSNERK